MEMLLTLHCNDYAPPASVPNSPRRESLLLRSLALGENLIEADSTHYELGRRLGAGQDFSGSDNIGLVQRSLKTLVDPDTLSSSVGARLMLPVHGSLLWYDVRTRGGAWKAQFVLMRGTGITLARFLLDPPESMRDLAVEAEEARTAIKHALLAESPFGSVADALSSKAETEPMKKEEMAAWNAAENPALEPLGRRLIRHSRAVMTDHDRPEQVRLLDLRRVVALDFAWYLLKTAWSKARTPAEHQYLALCHAPQERAQNRLRVISEASYQTAAQTLTRALLAELRRQMEEFFAATGGSLDWNDFFLTRSSQDGSAVTKRYYEALIAELQSQQAPDFDYFAGRAFDAPGDGFVRPIGAFRVMLESCGLLTGSGRWRYLRATPSLLSALVAARPQKGPQPADEFLHWLRDEWSLVVGEEEARSPRLRGEGSALQRNAEHFERDLVSCGLATALSDQTCMVAMPR